MEVARRTPEKRDTLPMNFPRKSQGTLSVAAIGAVLSWFAGSAGAIDGRPAPLPGLIDFAGQDVGLTFSAWSDGGPEAFGFLAEDEVRASPRVSLRARSAAGGISAVAGVAGAALGTGEAAGIWAVAAARLAFDAASRVERPVRSIRLDDAGYLDFSAAISRPNAPHRSLDNQMGIYQNAEFYAPWADPTLDFRPSKLNAMFSVYPSPGAAGLLLIAGGCAIGRRRRG
jgi:hypothetical protein